MRFAGVIDVDSFIPRFPEEIFRWPIASALFPDLEKTLALLWSTVVFQIPFEAGFRKPVFFGGDGFPLSAGTALLVHS